MSFRKNVFVLGAGFSKDAGAKTMDEFFPHARNLRDDPSSPLEPRDKQIFSRVIAYRFDLNKALAKILEDLDNIERLFGFLEMEVQLSPDGNKTLQDDMKYLIGRTLEVDTIHAAPNTPSVPRLPKLTSFSGSQYRLFAGMTTGLWYDNKLNNNRAIDSIITFNYDLVLERELQNLRILPIYNCGPNADYTPAFSDGPYQLNVLKLHGSINWGICRKCNMLYFLPYSPYLVKNFEVNVCTKCRMAMSSFLIVPPTWNKGTEEEFIRYVWQAALRELIAAGRIFIIGYSFPETDQFFKYMLGLALAHNNDLSEIYIVNPDEKVWDRFRALFHPHFQRRTVQYLPRRTNEIIAALPQLTRQIP